MRVRNVLVFPAATEIGLEILQALRASKEVRLFGAGQDIPNHATFAYPEYHILPSIYDHDWLERLVAVCNALSIDYIFPAYDDVLVALTKEVKRIPATLITSPPLTCELTRSKSATYKLLAGDIPVPRLYSSIADIDVYPVVVKPDRGQGSMGVHKVENEEALKAVIGAIKDPIICEYLPGEEYTVDCFSDRERGVLFAGARSRRRTRNGISVNTVTEDIPEAEVLANIISRKIDLHGGWFFQVKRAVNGRLALLEVAPRIAGSMAAHRVRGVNFPLLSIFEQERLPISIRPNPGSVQMDRALNNRYAYKVRFEVLYVDLDDTLLLNGRVNIPLIKLVFQCLNEGKRVILVTRHRGDLQGTLARHRLTGLFDQVVHVAEGDRKSKYLTEPNAIFVDDSYAERMEVRDNTGMLTFDCSMIEVITEQSESGRSWQ